MSSQSIPLNNGQQAIIQTETAKTFLWNRRSFNGIIGNSSYTPLVVPQGTIMGRISSTGLLTPFTSGASNGSQLPIGVMIGDVTVEFGQQKNITVCDDGDVNSSKLIFQGSDTLNTVVSGRQVRDWLKLVGIKVIESTEMTAPDNQ
jgi:hypothetical protein